MKARRAAWILAFGLGLAMAGTAARAQGALLQYIEQGCPSPDKPWSGADYGAFARMLETGKLPLLRKSDPELGTVFLRAVNSANLLSSKSREMAPELRMANMLGILGASAKVLNVYAARAAQGEPRPAEMALLMAFMLDGAATTMEIANEFLAGLPAEKQNEQTRQGSSQMQQGLTQTFDGALTAASDAIFFSAQDRLVILASFMHHFFRIQGNLPDTVVSEFRRKVGALESAEKDERVRATLTQTIEVFRSYGQKQP